MKRAINWRTKNKQKIRILLAFFILNLAGFSGITAQGLKDWAAAAGLNYGSMVHKAQFISTADSAVYRQTLRTELNMAFPENEIKWDAIEPSQGVFNFTYPDQVIAFAQANGMKSRGHFMIWHTNLPYWLTSRASGANKWTRTELMAVLKNHINTVIGHYKGKIHEYDVVNEPFNIGYNKPYGLRNSMFYDIIGPDYIDSAFVWAHRADPSAYLYLNEYGAEMASSSEKAKSDSLYKYVKMIKEKGVPIHGVGFEGHFGNYINAGTISANMKRLGDLGLRVSITELDMMNTTNIPINWYNLMKACVDNFNCTSFVTWGIDDKNSWMGSDCGCLVWDTTFQKKPAIYKALVDAMKTANPTITAKRKAFAAVLPFPQTPLPYTATPELTYCQGETATPLVATGTRLKWFNDINATVYTFTAPTPSTATVGTKSYFVSQTVNFIESPKTEIKVTVTAPTTWYKDEDGDGKGDPNVTLLSCTKPVGYVSEAATGIDEINGNNSNLLIYPQPFASNTLLKLTNNELIQSITISNISGAVISEIKSINSSEIQIGDNMSVGVYFVLVRTVKNTFKTKIIKLN